MRQGRIVVRKGQQRMTGSRHGGRSPAETPTAFGVWTARTVGRCIRQAVLCRKGRSIRLLISVVSRHEPHRRRRSPEGREETEGDSVTRLDECQQALGLTPGADYPEPKLDAAVNDYVAAAYDDALYKGGEPHEKLWRLIHALRIALGRALQQRDEARKELEER